MVVIEMYWTFVLQEYLWPISTLWAAPYNKFYYKSCKSLVINGATSTKLLWRIH